MQVSSQPRRISVTWASSAGSSYVRSVPDSGASGGDASYATGFPPLTFQPIASGGTPPAGQDMNGVLADLSAWARWQAAGGTASFDATFANAVGGYPAGAVLASTTPGLSWQSAIDNNTGNPDAGASGWLRIGGITQEGTDSRTINAGSSYTVNFPTPFPTKCTGFFCTPINLTASSRRDSFIQRLSLSAAGFTYVVQGAGTGGDDTLDGIDWFARGY